MRQRLTFLLVRAALTVLTAGLLGVLLAPAAADAAFFTYDAPSLSYDVEVNDAQLAVDNQHTSNGDGAAGDSGVTPASGPIGHVYDSAAIFVAPGSARGVRGLAAAGDELAQGGVYALRDPITGQVVRTGRTNSLTRRAGEHLRDPALADFEFEVIARTDVYAQQRGLEQLAHDAYTPAMNRIRPISPTNSNRATYVDAADDFLSIYGGG